MEGAELSRQAYHAGGREQGDGRFQRQQSAKAVRSQMQQGLGDPGRARAETPHKAHRSQTAKNK